MERRQATVVERVALQPIFDVCVIDIGYDIGGGIQVPWWRQEAADNQLKVTVASI